jgi:fluoroquinolone transport system permease protein
MLFCGFLFYINWLLDYSIKRLLEGRLIWMNKAKVLVISQFHRFSRENVWKFALVIPIFYAIALKYFLPIISEAALKQGIDLTEHYHAVIVFFVVLYPMLYGSVIGLMLLDEREENILSAIQVLPISMFEYLMSKCIVFGIGSIISSVLIIEFLDLYKIPLLSLITINIVAALEVCFFMLLINVFAKNKVEGFSAMKGMGFLMVIPIVALYLPKPYSFLCALVPGYWPAMAIASYQPAYKSPLDVYGNVLIGSVYILIITIVMYKVIMKQLIHK